MVVVQTMINETDQLRAQVYLLFIRLLSQPLEEESWQSLISWAKQADSSGFLKPVLAWVLEHQELDVLLSLSIKYSKLFSGLAQGYGPRPPYETLYRSQQAFSGNHYADVIKCYHRSGSYYQDPFDAQSDHLVSELAFMAEVIKMRHYELQLEFLNNHLTCWTGLWSQEVEKADKSGFYARCAQTLAEFIQHDCEFIQTKLG